MRDAWRFACALAGLLLWAAFRLGRRLFGRLYGSAVLAGLVVGRIAVDRGW